MSAEDWSLNGKITRTGSDESETAPGDETGFSETFVAIKREIVELISLSGCFSREKGNLKRSHSSEKQRPFISNVRVTLVMQQEASVRELDINFGFHM